jgi:hypothetical protein
VEQINSLTFRHKLPLTSDALQYVKLGLGYLFESQVIGWSLEYRKASYEKLAQAIRRAVLTHKKPKQVASPAAVHASADPSKVHATSDESFRLTVLEKYGSAEDAWRVFSTANKGSDGISRSDFKAMLTMLQLKLPKEETKKLRRQMDPENSKMVNKTNFLNFIKKDDNGAAQQTPSEKSESSLAALPVDAPALPDGGCSFLLLY